MATCITSSGNCKCESDSLTQDLQSIVNLELDVLCSGDDSGVPQSCAGPMVGCTAVATVGETMLGSARVVLPVSPWRGPFEFSECNVGSS